MQLRFIGVVEEGLTIGIETTGAPCKSGFTTFPTNTMVSMVISCIINKNGLFTSKTASVELPNRWSKSTSKI